MDVGWESAFVATSIALGDSHDDAASALGASSVPRVDADLASADKPRRTRALAHVLGAIAKDLDAAELRWPS